jgi:hypothetical protein
MNELYQNYGDNRWNYWFDGTVGGWIDPVACNFHINRTTFRVKQFDPRDYLDFSEVSPENSLRTIQKKERLELTRTNYLGTTATEYLQGVYTFLIHRGREAKLVFYNGAQPCWKGCTETISMDMLNQLCHGSVPGGFGLDRGSLTASHNMSAGHQTSSKRNETLEQPRTSADQISEQEPGFMFGEIGRRPMSMLRDGEDLNQPESMLELGSGHDLQFAGSAGNYDPPKDALQKRQADNAVQEKNWSPMQHEGKWYFLYTISPLQVCEVDLSMYEANDQEVPACAACMSKEGLVDRAHDPEKLFDTKINQMMDTISGERAKNGDHHDITLKEKAHLNGAPVLRMPPNSGLEGYVGVGHALFQIHHQEGLPHDKALTDTVLYAHFLFRLSPEPPFRVIDVSEALPLVSERSTAFYWVGQPEVDLKATFVSGLQWGHVRAGEVPELFVSYGAGDDQARLLRLKVNDLFHLFDGRKESNSSDQNHATGSVSGLKDEKSTPARNNMVRADDDSNAPAQLIEEQEKIADGSNIVKQFVEWKSKYPLLCSTTDGRRDVGMQGYYWIQDVVRLQQDVSQGHSMEVFDAFDPFVFYKLIRGKTLSFLGDSVTAQWYDQISCNLAPLINRGLNITVTGPGITSPHCWRCGLNQILIGSDTVIQFQFREEKDISQYREIEPLVFQSDIIVLNVGSHIHTQENFEVLLARYVSEFQNFNGIMYWREISPSHFGAGGMYESWIEGDWSSSNKHCQKTTQSSNPFLQWKLKFANEFMQNAGFKLLPMYNISLPAFALHIDARNPAATPPKNELDCLHWAQPSPVLDVWSSIFMELLKDLTETFTFGEVLIDETPTNHDSPATLLSLQTTAVLDSTATDMQQRRDIYEFMPYYSQSGHE